MKKRISIDELKGMMNAGVITSLDSSKGSKRKKRRTSLAPSVENNDKSRTRGGKYNAKKVIINSIEFDSKVEGQRYIFLLEQQRNGLISSLELQRKFEIEINGQFICSYCADFCYIQKVDDIPVFIVEDVKGMKTPVYRLKKKMLKASLGYDIKEITKENIGIL